MRQWLAQAWIAALATTPAGCSLFVPTFPRDHHDSIREAETDEDLLIAMRQIAGGVEPHRRFVAAPHSRIYGSNALDELLCTKFAFCSTVVGGRLRHPSTILNIVLRKRGAEACEVFLTLSDGDDVLSESILDAIQALFEDDSAAG